MVLWNATRRVVEGVPQKSGRYTYQIHVTEHGKTTSEKVTFANIFYISTLY